MKDVAGRDLEIGDIVAATYVGSPDMKVGKITRFTPKKIVVGFRSRPDTGSELCGYEEHKFPSQVCFIRSTVKPL
jgi:hypothetical protein